MKDFIGIEKSINPKVTSVRVRTIGSMLVAFSVLILFADKVFDPYFHNCFGYRTEKILIWSASQSLFPIILAIAIYLNPYKISFTSVIYVFSIQLHWVFDGSVGFDDHLVQLYAIGSVITFILIGYFIRKSKIIQDKSMVKANERIRINEEKLEVIKNSLYKKTA